MANRERGEFRLRVGDQAFTLRLTTNACAELEDLAGKPLDQVLKGLEEGRIASLREILWASLRDQHPEVATLDADAFRKIGDLVDRAGGIKEIRAQLRAFMKLNDEAPKDAAARPPVAPGTVARAGTGGSSTSPPGSSA